MSRGLCGLWWSGGKADSGGRGVGRWIASKLPTKTNITYVEPYCGMLGVLLQRPKSVTEVANDLNERVVNWWHVVKTRRDELTHALVHTPWAESVYWDARTKLDDKDELVRAIAFTIVVMCSQQHGDGEDSKGFAINLYPRKRGGSNAIARVGRKIDKLHDRVEDVQLYNRSAVDILRRMVDIEQSVIYCDPPYKGTYTKAYGAVQFDTDAMLEVLRAQRGEVAISGYGDEWDALGWNRHEHHTRTNVLNSANGTMHARARTEVLWCNYEPDQQALM